MHVAYDRSCAGAGMWLSICCALEAVLLSCWVRVAGMTQLPRLQPLLACISFPSCSLLPCTTHPAAAQPTSR